MQLFLIWIVALFLLGKQDTGMFRISGKAQGTTYQIVYYAADSIALKKPVDSIFNKIDSSLSIYKPYSLISRFNSAEKGLQIDEHFKTVVKRALEIHADTKGAFDVTVKPLVQAWGFGAQRVSELPDSAEVNYLLTCVGSDKIRLRKSRLLKTKSCVQVDVNGIAQGYTVDLLADLLEKNNIQNYLVELGGEIRIKGKKPDGTLMSVGIESPPENNGEIPVQQVIQLPDGGAITTSGNYRKYYQSGNRLISHLIDARTGYPVQNELVSVTVLARDAMTADGYDNALMSMGLEQAMAFMKRKKNMEAHFIYYKKNGLVADTATAGFYKFIRQ